MGHTDSESKSKNDLYRERNLLALAFIRYYVEYESMHGRFREFGWWPDTDDVNGEDWAVVWTDTEYGQVGWHIPVTMVPEWLPKRDPDYDGYSTQTKNNRLRWLVGLPDNYPGDDLTVVGGRTDTENNTNENQT